MVACVLTLFITATSFPKQQQKTRAGTPTKLSMTSSKQAPTAPNARMSQRSKFDHDLDEEETSAAASRHSSRLNSNEDDFFRTAMHQTQPKQPIAHQHQQVPLDNRKPSRSHSPMDSLELNNNEDEDKMFKGGKYDNLMSIGSSLFSSSMYHKSKTKFSFIRFVFGRFRY